MGFHQTAIEMLHKHFPNVPQYRIMPYQIYTHKDMVLHCANSSEKTGIHQNIIEISKALNTKFEICYNFPPPPIVHNFRYQHTVLLENGPEHKVSP